MDEVVSHTLKCPSCHKIVDTVPAEGVPDQALRGCPNCEDVFWENYQVASPY